MSLVGTTLGTLLVGAELGRGGMGTVYEATTQEGGPPGPRGTTVAVKVFHADQFTEEGAFEGFRREADIGKEIHHPNLVRTYGIASAEAEGRTHHYMVMERIEGRTLSVLRAELKTLPESLLFEIADQVLNALAALHARGIVHRDIKPDNIVITPDHRVLLMDFGVARRGREGARRGAAEFAGSFAYAPPEQFTGEDVGPRADLYALGMTLYELATGANPYAGLDKAAVTARKLDEEAPPPTEIDPDLGAFAAHVIETCLRRRPTERFASADELRRILSEGETGSWWRGQQGGRFVSSAQSALRRLRGERRAPLVGRNAELERLASAHERAARQGGVLLLSGPMGIGKSRLVREYLERVAGAGGPLLGVGVGRGTDGRGYGPFAEVLTDLLLGSAGPDTTDPDAALKKRLSELLPERGGTVEPLAGFVAGSLQPGAESGFSRDALFGAVADVFRALAKNRTMIVAIDDLDRADAGTVDLFLHLVRCVPGASILLLGTLERDALAAHAPLLALTTESAQHVEHLPLDPLDGDATQALIRSIVHVEPTVRAVAPTLRARSEGNVLLLLELIAHLESTGVLTASESGLVLAGTLDEVTVPSTVRELVGLRLASVSEEERELLETAAVLGSSFDVDLLAALLEEEPIELLQQLAALQGKHRLLESEEAGRFRFAAPGSHEAIYAGIPASLREEYHALVADTLLEDDPSPSGATAFELIHHLERAGRAREAEPFLDEALNHVGARLSASEAATLLARVAEAFAGAPARARLAIAMKRWSFHEMRAAREDELQALEVAGELADSLGDPEPRARVHALRAGTHWYAGDYDRAFHEAEMGLRLAREARSRSWEATCLHTLGVVAFRRGQIEACVEQWRAALAIRREIDDRRGTASTLQALALVMRGIGEEDQVLPTMQEALTIWREIGERRGEAAVLMNIGNHFVDSARYEEGLDHLQRALRMHRDTGALMNEAIVLTNMGHALNFLGRIDEARPAWERALGIFVDHGNPNGELAVRAMLGGALAEYGEAADAQDHLESAVQLAERTGNRAKLAMAHRALGELLYESGAAEAGWTHLDSALAIERELGDAGGLVLSLGLCGRTALRDGDAEQARDLLAEGLEAARTMESLVPLVLARLAWAEQASGRVAEAEAHAEEALERLGVTEAISPQDGPELFYALYCVLGRAELLARARALLDQRAEAVRNDTYREHLRARAWPAPEILGAADEKGPAADAAGPS